MAASPRRTCVWCRTTREKRELIRVARSPERVALVDPGFREPGRGAYVCRKEECVRRAIETGALGRALRLPVEDLATLRGEIEEMVRR